MTTPVAILAPYDKTGLAEFAMGLAEMGFDIYSTSGTQRYLAEECGLPVHSISSLTSFPEILDGRVKTLHPMVHGGLLARRDKPDHLDELERSGIPLIDLVCVNLYPFRETIERLSHEPPPSGGGAPMDALENIDIGGPTMLRAAAKNHPWVLAICDPGDYGRVLDCLRMEQVPDSLRRELAAKAFQHVASYDTMIAAYLRESSKEQGESSGGAVEFPRELTVGLELVAETRYGENPHQKGGVYRFPMPGAPAGIADAEQLHGLPMSYLNYLDADAAWRCALDFVEPTVVIVKHATPCGIASSADVASAYTRAYECDTVSPFGGIIAVNRPVTWDMTEAMKGHRYDIIVAPGYEDSALDRLRKRRDLRILQMPSAGRSAPGPEFRSILGGMLVQSADGQRGEDLDVRVATMRAPTAAELTELRFAWTCLKHVKSNAIVIAKDGATIGIGAGQPNRLWPTRQAIERAGDRVLGAVLGSDAFFPFARGDAVEEACRAGITAIIQPGGGVRDEEAVEVCNEYGVAMVFTGQRAFRH